MQLSHFLLRVLHQEPGICYSNTRTVFPAYTQKKTLTEGECSSWARQVLFGLIVLVLLIRSVRSKPRSKREINCMSRIPGMRTST